MSILLKHLHDRAAHAHPNPTEGQQRAGNYRKGHVKAHGLDVTIENAKGSIRRGTGRDGKPWQVRMAFPYGYIKRTTGADGDHVDVTIGPHLKCPRIYVVDQRDADTGKFDEHKVYMGFASADHVRRAYRQGFSDRRGDDRMGAITEMSPDQFRSWLKAGDTTKPLHRAAGGRVGYDDGGEVLDDSVSRGLSALSQTWPVRMAQSLGRAVMAPGNALRSTPDNPVTTEQMIEPAADLAGLVMGGTSFGAPVARAGDMVAGAGPVRRAASLPMDETSRMARAADQGFDGPWYHGSMRADRLTENGKIDPRRATSGPMPFFTDDPRIASNYATSKADTSMVDNGLVTQYFHVDPKAIWPDANMRAPVEVEKSWHFLPRETQNDILAKAKRVGYENPSDAAGPYTLHPPGVEATLSPDHFDYLMKTSARGNPLTALREMWMDGGELVRNEHQMMDIWRLAGYPHPISDKAAPWYEARGVMPAMLKMRNPLDTGDQRLMTDEVLPALEKAFARDRTRKREFGADDWDKTVRYTPREWVEQARADYAKGDNSFVWTSIPDKVTAELKRLGYDGVIDTGGKTGGQGHRVAVPFGPDQVRSRFAAFDPKNEGKSMLLGSGSTDKSGAPLGLAPAVGGNGEGIRAYHGSPHDFDRFDLSKIGTGEGAQAYGHGLYFAENPSVAESYKFATSGRNASHSFDGKPLQSSQDWYRTVDALNASGDWRSAKVLQQYANSIEPDTTLRIRQLKDWYRNDPEMIAAIDRVANRVSSDVPKGRMYEVNINAHPDQFLDWDKPLSQMSPEVQQRLNDAWLAHPEAHANQTGGQIYEASRIVPGDYRDPSAASKVLRDAGISGIKYLDQGSRGAGAGSSNFVVFDDKLVNILRKYKKGGAVGYAEGGSITDADMGFGGGSGGASITDADMGFGASPAAAPAPKKPDDGPTFWGTMGQAALGVPRGLLDIAGALGEAVTAKPLRDVAAAKAAAAAQTEGGVEFTPEDAQRAAFRKTMETTPSYGHQMREAAGLEGQMAPKNAAERIASGIGEGAAGAVLAPGAMLPNAVLGGFAGGVGRGAAEVAPDPYKPIAELAGNVLGVAAGAGAAAIPGVASRGVSRMVKPVTQAGQEEIAARYLESRMANPDAVRQTLQQPTQEIIPGSKPTLFQETGDMGLGALERENLQTRAPQDFMQRRADQNAARLDTIENLVASGDPRDVSRAVTAQMNAIDTATQQAVDRLTREARDRAAAIGGHNAPEAYGAELRTALRSAEDEARMYERALWDNVDPTNSMTIDMRPLQAAHAAIYGDLTAAARASLSPVEQTVAHLIDGYNGVMPFRELTDARSLVSSAMREELKDRGRTPAYARLAQLRGAMEDRINGVVTERAADDAARVSAGEMPSEQALASRIQQLVAEWQSGRATGANAAAGNGEAATVGPASGRAAPRTGGEEPGGPGVDARDQGVQGPTFDPAAAERLRDATRATRERATTFGADPLKGILRREQQGGPYVMRDAMVPEKVFRPGPAGAQDLGRFVDAVGAERALPVISDYAASSLRRSAMDADGMIDPARFDTWRRRHSEALRAVPGLERRFSDAARAAQEVADATALRRSAINEAQQGVFGRLIGAEDVQDIRKVVGSTLSSAAETKRLMAAVRGHPGGLDGMRRAVVDYMTSKLISNTEGATTGRGLIKSDQFQTFVRQHEDSLRAVLTPEQFATLRNVADDLQRANRSLTAVKIPGQSNTAQDFYATMEGASRLGQLMANLASGATSMASRVVPGGRHAVTGAEIAVNAARTAGFSKVDALVRQALLDPEFARLLLQKVPRGTARAADRVFARRLLSLSAADMARYSQTEGNRQ